LKDLGMWSEAAENLVLGTAAQESHLGRWLIQTNRGARTARRAKGIFQIENRTHNSIWNHYLAYRPELASKVRGYASQHNFDKSPQARHRELIFNLYYSAAICRLKYWPKPYPLPNADDIYGLGMYWDKHYNCNPEHGTPENFLTNYNQFVRT